MTSAGVESRVMPGQGTTTRKNPCKKTPLTRMDHERVPPPPPPPLSPNAPYGVTARCQGVRGARRVRSCTGGAQRVSQWACWSRGVRRCVGAGAHRAQPPALNCSGWQRGGGGPRRPTRLVHHARQTQQTETRPWPHHHRTRTCTPPHCTQGNKQEQQGTQIHAKAAGVVPEK
jgi:hypothetical protein